MVFQLLLLSIVCFASFYPTMITGFMMNPAPIPFPVQQQAFTCLEGSSSGDYRRKDCRHRNGYGLNKPMGRQTLLKQALVDDEELLDMQNDNNSNPKNSKKITFSRRKKLVCGFNKL